MASIGVEIALVCSLENRVQTNKNFTAMYLTKSRPCGTAVSRPNYSNDPFMRQFFGPTLGSFQAGGPATNIKESDQAYSLDLIAPGIPKENFKLKVEQDKLVVSADWESQTEEENTKFVRREFAAQKFQKTFILPENADYEKISAQHVNGVLHILIPKKENKQANSSKSIAVN
jgi:HSP20 family protein